MRADKMHSDEVETDKILVQRLVTAQFPEWANLPIQPVPSAGTDNALYRLGQSMVVRLPRISAATRQVDLEHEWLPRLAPHLPLSIPCPLVKGMPGEGYPWHWSVYSWLEGNDAVAEGVNDLAQAATDLANFIRALQKVDPVGGPPSGRGPRLRLRDEGTRRAIAALRESLDTESVTAAWEKSLQTSEWEAPPVWTHGDLLPTNLLIERGRITAVIDFGGVGVGDPACDLVPAWSVLSGATRLLFRSLLAVDDSTWVRGRGWALSQALIIVPYYQNTNPALVTVTLRVIDEVLAEFAGPPN
jgi:aminoglycoside phosphotransferase (APT) family kinase protein